MRNVEKTLILIKPGHLSLADEVFSRLDKVGKRLMQKKIENAPKEVIEKHYGSLREKPYFQKLINGYAGKSFILSIYEGEGIIEKVKELCGPTCPSEGKLGQIRRDLSQDSRKMADLENRPLENVIHRSDNPQEYEQEFDAWRNYMNETRI